MTSASLLHLESPAVAKKVTSTPNETISSSPSTVIKTAPPRKKFSSSWLDSLEFTKGKSLSEETLIMAEQDPILPKDSSINDRGCCHRCCPRVFYAILDACIYTFCLVKNVEPSPEEGYQNPPEDYDQREIRIMSSNGEPNVVPVLTHASEEDPLLPVPVELLATETPKQQPQPSPQLQHSPHSPKLPQSPHSPQSPPPPPPSQ